MRGEKFVFEKRGNRERAVPAPDANAELLPSMQKRQAQSNLKSRSEVFSSHPEEVASGFRIDPPKPSQSVEDADIDLQGCTHKRASHSGPLVNRAAWSKSGKNMEDASALKNPDVSELSAMSGLVASRRSMLSEKQKQEAPKLMSQFPGSYGTMRQDQKHGRQQAEERATSNNSVPGKGSISGKIHYSGPLLAASGKVDQMLKDHDRQIQEAVRRSRLDKERLRKQQVGRNQLSMNTLFISGR